MMNLHRMVVNSFGGGVPLKVRLHEIYVDYGGFVRKIGLVSDKGMCLDGKHLETPSAIIWDHSPVYLTGLRSRRTLVGGVVPILVAERRE